MGINFHNWRKTGKKISTKYWGEKSTRKWTNSKKAKQNPHIKKKKKIQNQNSHTKPPQNKNPLKNVHKIPQKLTPKKEIKNLNGQKFSLKIEHNQTFLKSHIRMGRNNHESAHGHQQKCRGMHVDKKTKQILIFTVSVKQPLQRSHVDVTVHSKLSVYFDNLTRADLSRATRHKKDYKSHFDRISSRPLEGKRRRKNPAKTKPNM